MKEFLPEKIEVNEKYSEVYDETISQRKYRSYWKNIFKRQMKQFPEEQMEVTGKNILRCHMKEFLQEKIDATE